MENSLSRGLVSYQAGSPRLHQPPRSLVVFWVGVDEASNNLFVPCGCRAAGGVCSCQVNKITFHLVKGMDPITDAAGRRPDKSCLFASQSQGTETSAVVCGQGAGSTL